jgi:hypothetical protein
MKLPNAHLAIVEREKITEYLLSVGIDTAPARRGSLWSLGFGWTTGQPGPCAM